MDSNLQTHFSEHGETVARRIGQDAVDRLAGMGLMMSDVRLIGWDGLPEHYREEPGPHDDEDRGRSEDEGATILRL